MNNDNDTPLPKDKFNVHSLDFVIAGFPKCATTSIIKYLEQFPEISCIADEPAFFLDLPPEKQKYTRARYFSKFKVGKVNGEKTPAYIYSPKAMDRLSKNKNLKLIICVRHPILWLESFYNYRVLQSDKFPKITGNTLTNIVNNHKYVEGISVDRGKFAMFIRSNLLPKFDRKNIIFIVQEEFENDKKTTLDRICTFLDIDKTGDIRKTIELNYYNKQPYVIDLNTDKSYVNNFRKQLIEEYKPYNEDLFKIIGRRITLWDEIDEKIRQQIA